MIYRNDTGAMRLSLRDWIALARMFARSFQEQSGYTTPSTVAEDAYETADRMIERSQIHERT